MGDRPDAVRVEEVLRKLDWMRRERIWPNGLRYLWTDAFGVVLLVSLGEELREDRYVQEAERVVAEVERVLGRPRGLRIGEAPDRDGQYFHYLAMWLFALSVLGERRATYRDRAIALVQQIHPRFVLPGVGVIWKMREDLSEAYPGFGLGRSIRSMGTWCTDCSAKASWPERYGTWRRSCVGSIQTSMSLRTSASG